MAKNKTIKQIKAGCGRAVYDAEMEADRICGRTLQEDMHNDVVHYLCPDCENLLKVTEQTWNMILDFKNILSEDSFLRLREVVYGYSQQEIEAHNKALCDKQRFKLEKDGPKPIYSF